MFGRGRARNIGEDGLGTPPRRPGMPPVTSIRLPGGGGLRDPSTKLHLLDCLFEGTVDDITVFKALHNYIQSSPHPDIDKLIDYIMSRVLLDSSNSDNIAKYIWIMKKSKKGGGELILHKFFTRLENQYSNREKYDILLDGPKYRNFVAMFSSVAHYTRNQNFPPFDELVNGLYQLMMPLTKSNNEEDMRILALCVVRYSTYLKSIRASKEKRLETIVGDLDQITVAMRKKIESKSEALSENSVAWLMLALEACNIGIEGLSDSVRLHYVSLLGHKVYILGTKYDKIRIPKNDASKYSLEDPQNIILV